MDVEVVVAGFGGVPSSVAAVSQIPHHFQADVQVATSNTIIVFFIQACGRCLVHDHRESLEAVGMNSAS